MQNILYQFYMSLDSIDQKDFLRREGGSISLSANFQELFKEEDDMVKRLDLLHLNQKIIKNKFSQEIQAQNIYLGKKPGLDLDSMHYWYWTSNLVIQSWKRWAK